MGFAVLKGLGVTVAVGILVGRGLAVTVSSGVTVIKILGLGWTVSMAVVGGS